MKKIRRGWIFLGVLMAIVLAIRWNSAIREETRREYAERVMQEEDWLLQALSDMRQGTEPDEAELQRRLPGTKEICYWDHYMEGDGLFLVMGYGFMMKIGFLLTETPIASEDIALAEKCGVVLTEWAEGERSRLYGMRLGRD